MDAKAVMGVCSSARVGRRGWGVLGSRVLVGGLAALTACGSPGGPASSGAAPGGEASSGAAPSSGETPVEQADWAFPEGGAVVDGLANTDNQLQAIDAFGNLWIRSCEGLFVANEREVRRYRYLDTPWERGGGISFADGQGRIWYSSVEQLSVLERGQWREAPALGSIVVGSDGVAWALARGPRPGDVSIAAVWPEVSPPIPAPRWLFETFVGQNGGIWYRTSLTAASELWHFDGQRFAGPFTVDHGFFFYDSLDDTMGIVRPEQGELIKVRYDGAAIVEVSRSPVSWRDALGRQSDGYLIARSHEGELLVVDGERTLPLPALSRRQVRGQLEGKLSPTGELYLENDFGVFHFRDGELHTVIEYVPHVAPVHAWASTGYGSTLRAESAAATRAEFEPEVPAIFGEKVHVTGHVYFVGFEAPGALAVDGAPVNVAVATRPELYEFLTEHGLDLVSAAREYGGFDPSAAPWDLFGYLEPGPCYWPGEKTFHVVEAYPRGMPAQERAALEAELRARHPL